MNDYKRIYRRFINFLPQVDISTRSENTLQRKKFKLKKPSYTEPGRKKSTTTTLKTQ